MCVNDIRMRSPLPVTVAVKKTQAAGIPVYMVHTLYISSQYNSKRHDLLVFVDYFSLLTEFDSLRQSV